MSILCYHAVAPDWPSPLAVTPEAFRQQCGWLASHRAVVPLEEVVRRLDRRWRPQRGLAAITFDDGFADLYEHALPVLKAYRLPATVFVVAETLTAGGRRIDWVDTPPDRPMRTLTIDQLLELRDLGIEIGSHSWSHRRLTELSEEECTADLRRSRELLEDVIDGKVRHVAYPRGLHDAAVRSAAARAGFEHGFTLPEGPEPVGPHAVPRVGVYPGNTATSLRWKTMPVYLSLRASRAYPVVRRVVKGSPPPSRRLG